MIGIIVPTHNRRQNVEALAQTIDSDNIIGVIISSCDSVGHKITSTKWHLLKVEGSSYWSASINTGFRYLKSLKIDFSHVVLLNDDLHISVSDLQRLVQLNDGSFISSPLILDFHNKNKIVFSGKKWSNFTCSYVESVVRLDCLQDLNYVDVLPGNCMVIPFQSIVHMSSLVDEVSFPHVYGDATLCLDMKKEFGMNSVVFNDVIAYDDTSDKETNNYIIQGLQLSIMAHFTLVFCNIKSGLFLPALISFKFRYSKSVLLGLVSLTFILAKVFISITLKRLKLI